jgi:toxin ParE1/3/4
VKPAYVLTSGAEEDLRGIIGYTVDQWGAEQCRTYVAALEEKATALALGQGVFKDMSSLLPGLRVGTSGKHYIFCMPRDDEPAIILAILHERMDILTHLTSRLKD